MKVNELHDQPVKPDTYEAGMALNQLLKIGTHAIKIHNMIDDDAEMEAWVAKKIDLASNETFFFEMNYPLVLTNQEKIVVDVNAPATQVGGTGIGSAVNFQILGDTDI